MGEGEGWGFTGRERGNEVDGREDKYFLGLMHLFEKQVPHFCKRSSIVEPGHVSPRQIPFGTGQG
jgi:hypothetical protein